MKNQHSILRLTALFTLACAAFSMAGCAGMNASRQESLLTAAGFRIRTPETPQQKTIYATLPPYKVHHGVVNGKIFYAYKDEKKAVAYVGGEQEYQHYQQLAIAQQIASDNYQAAEMNQQMATGWYGAWGYGSMGPGYFRLR